VDDLNSYLEIYIKTSNPHLSQKSTSQNHGCSLTSRLTPLIMEDTGPTYPERPAKRVRQACELCRSDHGSCPLATLYLANQYSRRKKAKCPGEQPVCSLCARLRQQCVYADERRRPPPTEEPARLSVSGVSASHTLVSPSTLE
jgi:hypothetical protein